ncbi:MAG: hypothetical protein MJZ66_06730 [Bacteroidales bacterium]|nr:hypothetical protein [Bacteroidales bacterium]
MDNSLYTGVMPEAISRNEAKNLVLKRFEAECVGATLQQIKSQLSGIKLQYYPYATYKGDISIRLSGSLEEYKTEVVHGSENQLTTNTYEYAIDMEGSSHIDYLAVPLYDDSIMPHICNIDSMDPAQAGPFSIDMLDKITIEPTSADSQQALQKAETLAGEIVAHKMLEKHTGKYTGGIETIQCQMQQTGKILQPIYKVVVKLFMRPHTILVNATTGQLYDTEPEIDQPGIAQGHMFQSPYFHKALKVAAAVVLLIDIIWLIYYLMS